MKNFIDLFSGLQRAHGCTYVEKKNADGTKIKGKSFVKREPVTEQLWTNHLNGIEPSLGIIPIDEDNKCKWEAGTPSNLGHPWASGRHHVISYTNSNIYTKQKRKH